MLTKKALILFRKYKSSRFKEDLKDTNFHKKFQPNTDKFPTHS